MGSGDTIEVFVPLKLRKTNGHCHKPHQNAVIMFFYMSHDPCFRSLGRLMGPCSNPRHVYACRGRT